MRLLNRAIAKIDDEIKTLETLRGKLPDGVSADADSVFGAEIDMLKNVRTRLAALLPAEKEKKAPKAKPAAEGKK